MYEFIKKRKFNTYKKNVQLITKSKITKNSEMVELRLKNIISKRLRTLRKSVAEKANQDLIRASITLI